MILLYYTRKGKPPRNPLKYRDSQQYPLKNRDNACFSFKIMASFDAPERGMLHASSPTLVAGNSDPQPSQRLRGSQQFPTNSTCHTTVELLPYIPSRGSYISHSTGAVPQHLIE